MHLSRRQGHLPSPFSTQSHNVFNVNVICLTRAIRIDPHVPNVNTAPCIIDQMLRARLKVAEQTDRKIGRRTDKL